ncbi:MAG: M20 family metallopeptidase [Nitrososphaeria archaeon]|nr:M20 family metallopeptidase [Nitrososphaeria archaeon]
MLKNIDKILDNINEEKVIYYTRKLVNFDTQNPPGKEKELAEYLADFLKNFGLKTTLLDFLPNRPNLFAEYKFSDREKTFLFDGHLDTVPVGNLSLWNFDPFSGTVKDGKLYGRGSADMKGSIAAFIHALETLIDSGIKLEGNICMILTSDEEISGLGTRDFIKKGYFANVSIVGEPSCLEVNVAHKGVARWKLKTLGKSTHASTPEEGINAIYKMANVISELEKLAKSYSTSYRIHPLLGTPTLNVGTIFGGTKDNVVPDFCEITIDRRLLPGDRVEDVEKEFYHVLGKLSSEDPCLKFELKLYHSHNPAETPSDHPFVILANSAVERILGEKRPVKGFQATTEMSHLVEAGIPSLILGAGDIRVAHTVNEFVPVDELVKCARIYALILVNYLSSSK